MPNRLADEKSPYLQQHADNPVDWYPWGDEAMARARDEDKPILVSIGYSACHWCHVMAHESFEDADVARLMNERFVNIKVDREERPDVDAIYMEAVQAMTGHGGWPLNMFLTPDLRPFFGGTYFPPAPRHGMPSWSTVLASVADAYRDRRGDVVSGAAAVLDYLRRAQSPEAAGAVPESAFRDAYGRLSGEMDWRNGGFGGPPKFPQPLALDLMLRLWQRINDPAALEFVALTLRRMAAGGIFDQLGGGFHRYSVDGVWLVPHFEKMLYDNALLMRAYLHAFQATGDPLFRGVVERTAGYLLRDMRSPEGAFWSAEDADSESEEGRFYVWTQEELRAALGSDAELAALRFGVSAKGNFEARSILTLARTVPEVAQQVGIAEAEAEARLQRIQERLLEARGRRPRPQRDTKILAGWSGLAITALAEAGLALERPEYVSAARAACDFILRVMMPAGRLLRAWKDGPGRVPAFLEDYAFLLEALVSLYEAAFEERYLEAAGRLADDMISLFWDSTEARFYDTASDAEELPVRPRGLFDNPIPSGNAAASMGLLRLHALTGDDRYSAPAVAVFETASAFLARAPLAVPYLLSALDFQRSTPLQIAIAVPDGQSAEQMLRVVARRYLPNKVLAVGRAGSSPLLAGRAVVDGRPTAFVCENFACRMPVSDPAALRAQLDARGGSVDHHPVDENVS